MNNLLEIETSMKYSKIWFLILLISIISIQLSAQTKTGLKETNLYTLHGIVKDSANGEMLIGVTVMIKELKKGTATGLDGSYNIKIAEGKYSIVFSYVGYETIEKKVNLNKDILLNIVLKPSLANLNEVVIVGQRKFFGNMDYGREIPVINSKIIALQNINNASDILHASVAGVWATKTSGSPGDHQKIRIRGQNSFFSSAEPLYVVDGVPVPIVNMSSLGIADLNINDIESVTVLKDASSSALYGFQGGNGVVLIDTKKGGEKEITFSTKFGTQWFDNFYDLMSSEEQITSFQKAKNTTRIILTTVYPGISDSLCNRDWQKEIFKTGFMTENQLSASGTFHKTKYYLSGNFMKHTGNLEGSKYDRYTFLSKFTRQFNKRLAIDLGYRGSIQQNENNQDLYNGNPLLFRGISKTPCLECIPDSLIYNESGEMNRLYYRYPGLNGLELPESIVQNNKHSLHINSNILSGSARLQLSDHLSINAMGSFMIRHSNYNYNPGKSFIKSNEDVLLFNQQYNISYINSFGKHKIDLVAAYRYYQDNLWWELDTTNVSYNLSSPLRNSMIAYGPKGSVLRTINSYVANVSYNYRETYFISAVTNISKIKEGLNINYYSIFPSLAFSWDLSKESILRNITWLNNFNLYVNWGKSGNYPLNGLANDLYSDVNFYNGSYFVTSPAVRQLANHYLKHENTTETDYGFKTSIINNRLTINGVYYKKKIEDLILQRDIPDYYGGGRQYINLGEISINGLEFGLEANPVRTKNFDWNMRFNYSTFDHVIEKINDDRSLSFDNYGDVLTPFFIMEEGKQMGVIYGYKCLGKWTTADENEKNKLYLKSGGMKFLNADSSNTILNSKDRVVIGNSIPKYTWNFSNTFRYKNFSIDLEWYAVIGVDKYNATRAATLMTGVNPDINKYINDSLTVIKSAVFYQSSEFIDDAGFIRLKTVSIIYEPSKEFFGHSSLRFSLSFENLITITNYRGYDPEATTFTNNNFSDNAIDRGAVPNPKGVYAKIGVRF
jgi:TonB-dependent starch-binding outer membrane protein SusC